MLAGSYKRKAKIPIPATPISRIATALLQAAGLALAVAVRERAQKKNNDNGIRNQGSFPCKIFSIHLIESLYI